MTSRFGVILAVLALSLRLAWPMPPALPTDIGGLADLDLHALCLATPTNTDLGSVSGNKLPPPTGDHADHDHSLCCLWHASAGFSLPQIATAERIVFVATMLLVAATAADFRPGSLTGPTRARGPPQEA